MTNISEQYLLMKQGKSFSFDEYLFKRQKECAHKLSKINSLPFGNRKREKLLRVLFAHLGDNTVIKEKFYCNFGFNISIGNNCYINFGLTVLDSYEVEIKDNVFIAPNVIISPVTHPLEATKRRNLTGGKITIEADVWIGANAVILPGVTIHHGAVIGAGAVVKNDVAPNTVVGGVPAHFLKNVYKGEE